MIDAYASRPHYWRHLAPLVFALRLAGQHVRVWSPVGVEAPWGDPVVPGSVVAACVLVASEADARVFTGTRKVVYLEHGAGQTYVDAAEQGEGYAGGPRLGHCVLFLAPSEHVAERWRAAYPDTLAVAVGCPALDQHRPRETVNQRRRIYITAHWRCGVVPETWWALDDFASGLPILAEYLRKIGVDFIGHAHPKDARRIADRWAKLGIPYEPDPDVVLHSADLLIGDNTSLMYEAAALDIPVLALNATRYRKDVEHGLRFWSHVPGLQCDTPLKLVSAVRAALVDATPARALRHRAAAYAYCSVDGHAATRAVAAIERVIA